MNASLLKSEIRLISHQNGEIQRVQCVRARSFEDIGFFRPSFSLPVLKSLYEIYRDEIIPQAPALFGDVFIFHVPEDLPLPFPIALADRQAAGRKFLMDSYPSEASQAFLRQLESTGCLYHLKGKNPLRRSFVAYGQDIGFLSRDNDDTLRVNSCFFTFDLLDADSPYDCFGTPLGLMVKDGRILNPPLFDREALLVRKDGKVVIRPLSLSQLDISVRGTLYQRPYRRQTPDSENDDVVIIGNRIIAVNPGGRTVIPSSGFVINTAEKHQPGEEVSYGGLEDVVFGLQVGNSVIVDGQKSERFISPFYDLRRLQRISYPPALFPLRFDRDRAPRIVLGADRDNRPVILWLEGAPKKGYLRGIDSCGATMKETADIAADLGLVNAISLDGGGSAQILLNGSRQLSVSGRYPDGREKERAVPVGLRID